ncbi:MAG: hypothetical protein M3409_11020, partial [Gemmatimonadota bacterium]|nr:hypothetical protein [Gemmatimonadota bacterium]
MVSVVVPVNERIEPLPELYDELAAPLRAAGLPFEFIFVVEPWAAAHAEPLRARAAACEPVRIVELAQTGGEAALLRLGFDRARGGVVVTHPPYRRVEASALPELVAHVRAGADLVVARRWPRRDSWVNRAQNRALHALIRRLGGGRIHDVACGVRALRPEVLDQIPLYGDNFRFIPLLAMRQGLVVQEVDVPQHPRDVRARVYAPGIYIRRLIDVLGLFFLLRFTEKPLRFFGLIGGTLTLAGAALLLVLLVQRLMGEGLSDRPVLLLAALLLVLGIQAVALGLIGEIIVHLRAP